MNKGMNTRWIRGLLLSPVLLLPLAANPAHACFDVDVPPSPDIWFTSAGTPMVAQIAINGPVIKSAGVVAGAFCAVGLGHSGSLITAVTAVTVEDGPTEADSPPPALLSGFSFSPNVTSTGAFSALDPLLTWAGFQSGVSVPLAPGDNAVVRFTVEVPPGTTLSAILADLTDFAFHGSDDADPTGNLLGTSQSVDGLEGEGFLTLPFCDEGGTLDPGEVCDNDSPSPCNVGEVCLECSACVVSSFADRCKSAALVALGKGVAKKRLKCHVKAAKLAASADPTCLALADLTLVETLIGPDGKIAQSDCPQALAMQLPTSTFVDNLFNVAINDLLAQLPLGTSAGANKCASRKLNAASLRLVNSLNCHAKALKQSLTVDPVCLTKTATKFDKKFNRATTVDCDPGHATLAAVAARVDLWVNDTVTVIPPP